jgi:hypothetical protein
VAVFAPFIRLASRLLYSSWKGNTMIPNFEDKRAVKLEKVLSPDFIPLFSGRPQRSLVIGKDDSLDLKIILNTTDSVEAFLGKI